MTMDYREYVRDVRHQAERHRTNLLTRIKASGTRAETAIRMAQVWEAYRELAEKLEGYLGQVGEISEDILYRQARYAQAEFMGKLDRFSRSWFRKGIQELDPGHEAKAEDHGHE